MWILVLTRGLLHPPPPPHTHTHTVGSDFLDSTQTIVFLPGETLKVVTISILDDDMVEDDEILQVSISVADSDVVLLESEANVTILDDDSESIPNGQIYVFYTIVWLSISYSLHHWLCQSHIHN